MKSQQERATEEVLSLATGLARLVMSGSYPSAMKALAMGILGLNHSPTNSTLKTGKVFADDLVIGGVYIARGWADHSFEWVFLGKIHGDSSRISIKRSNNQISVELLGDHGLAAYDIEGQNLFWHPTNWTEGMGFTEEQIHQQVVALQSGDIGDTNDTINRPDYNDEEDNEF